MKILYYASIDFYTRPNPTYHLMCSLIEDLLAFGNEVHFVGCKDISIDIHIPQNLIQNKAFTYDLVDVKPIKKSAFVRRYLGGIITAIRTAKYLKCTYKFDVIFVQSSPTVLFNLYFAKRHAGRAKIVYNIQDMFPGSSIACGIMPNKLMQHVFFWLQKFAYAMADAITVIADDMKRKVIEQGVPEEKIHVIVNWYDDKSVHEVAFSSNRFAKKYNMSEDKIYVQYAGTMGYVFDYNMVVQVAEILKDRRDIVFQMVGIGSQKESFQKTVQEKNLDNVVFYPLEPQEMVSDVYSACTVCLIPLKPGIIGNSVPSKAGLLMACKRPIINSVDENSDYYRMFNDNGIGLSISNQKPEKVAEALTALCADKMKIKEYVENGYGFGEKLYCRKNNTIKYNDLFLKLIK